MTVVSQRSRNTTAYGFTKKIEKHSCKYQCEFDTYSVLYKKKKKIYIVKFICIIENEQPKT